MTELNGTTSAPSGATPEVFRVGDDLPIPYVLSTATLVVTGVEVTIPTAPPAHYFDVEDAEFAVALRLGVRYLCGAYGPPPRFMQEIEVVGGIMPLATEHDCGACVAAYEVSLSHAAADLEADCS